MNTLHLVYRDIVDLQAVNSTNAGYCHSLPFNLYVCRRKMQILLSLPEQKQISYAGQSENFATDVLAAFSNWVIDHLVDLHQTPPMAASMIFATRDSRFTTQPEPPIDASMIFATRNSRKQTQPELLVGFATRDSRANVN